MDSIAEEKASKDMPAAFQERKDNRMLRPDSDTIMKLAKKYSVIPISRELFGDSTTPIAILRKLAQKSSRYFLLESVENGANWGRYSFLGCDPVMRVTCREDEITIQEQDQSQVIRGEDPFQVLRDILKNHKAPKVEGMPPFAGGFVGYFAYAMIAHAEPKLKIRRGDFADYDLMLFDKVIAYDHLKQKIIMVANVRTDGNIEENYK